MRSQFLHQRVLRQVRILELVHQHVAETLGIFIAHRRVAFQQACGVEQDVVEVHGVAGDESLLVFDVNTRFTTSSL